MVSKLQYYVVKNKWDYVQTIRDMLAKSQKSRKKCIRQKSDVDCAKYRFNKTESALQKDIHEVKDKITWLNYYLNLFKAFEKQERYVMTKREQWLAVKCKNKEFLKFKERLERKLKEIEEDTIKKFMEPKEEESHTA